MRVLGRTDASAGGREEELKEKGCSGSAALILQRFRQSLLLPVLRYDTQGPFQDLHILAGLYRRNLTPDEREKLKHRILVTLPTG